MFDAIDSSDSDSAGIDVGELIGYAGIDGLGDVSKRKRLKQPTREADWAAIIDQIMVKFELTYDELSDMTGISVSSLQEIRKEKQVFSSGNKALCLLGLFTMNIGTDVPLLGDYHEIGKDAA